MSGVMTREQRTIMKRRQEEFGLKQTEMSVKDETNSTKEFAAKIYYLDHPTINDIENCLIKWITGNEQFYNSLDNKIS